MSIELQIRSSILGAIIAQAMQARLRTTCFAPNDSFYVDHANVADAPVELVAANATVRVHVPLDVFIVRREDVLAAPNAVPTGATVPTGRVVLQLELATSKAVVSLRCIDADLGQLGAALGANAPAAKAAIVAAVGSPITSDLTAALQQLGLPAPNLSRAELTGSIVALRFEPVGNAAEHLFPGQEWGLFVDGISIEQLARSKVPSKLGSRLTSMTINPHWRPAGSMPHVDLDYVGKAQVPDPFSGIVDGTLGCDFSLTPPPFQGLRTTIHWSLHVNLGDWVPGFIDNLVESAIEGAMDPTKFGGTPIGDRAFTLDSSLPDVSFGGARFGYASTVASLAGMTIGGAVHLPIAPSRNTVQPSVRVFGLPSRLDICSVLARVGSGAPSQTVLLDEVTTSSGAWLESCGALCDVEIVSPGTWIKTYLHAPTGGTVAETNEISIVIPSAVALGIAEPVRLIVRTARGVRLVDLGIPPPVKLDDLGHVTNALTPYIDDCPRIPVGPEDGHGINWGRNGHDLVINPDPPLETDWATYVGRQRGLDIQLVTLSGLEPGELIQFRSHDHAVDVTADHNGRAMVPVLLPLTNNHVQATLTRVNRRGVADHFTIRTAIFQKQATLPAGRQNRLVSSVDGGPALMTEFEDRVNLYELGHFGTPTLVGKHQFPQSDQALGQSLGQDVDLPGLISLHPVPGFADEPIAIAAMADGSMLVLDLSQDGTPRVTGTFTGPIDALDVSDDWACSANDNQVSIYKVTRS
jgi:hypothetical protein